jgi:hypothetical protein
VLHLEAGIADHDDFGGFAAMYLENFWLEQNYFWYCTVMPLYRYWRPNMSGKDLDLGHIINVFRSVSAERQEAALRAVASSDMSM